MISESRCCGSAVACDATATGNEERGDDGRNVVDNAGDDEEDRRNAIDTDGDDARDGCRGSGGTRHITEENKNATAT